MVCVSAGSSATRGVDRCDAREREQRDAAHLTGNTLAAPNSASGHGSAHVATRRGERVFRAVEPFTDGTWPGAAKALVRARHVEHVLRHRPVVAGAGELISGFRLTRVRLR